jgi:S-methylmethionine-dependent homocysteine/selenocysteine methylase
MKQFKRVLINESPALFQSGYFLTDGGLETTLIFHYNIELPHFAAFELLNTGEGREALKNYYEPYFRVAQRYGLTYILETPTWRANPDWGFKLGYSRHELNSINRLSVLFLREMQLSLSPTDNKILVSGCIGPRGDGYSPTFCMTLAEAIEYHGEQIRTFALADVDIITGMTLNYSDEGTGIVLASKSVGVPVVISFTVETDGRLPNGESLGDAIQRVDSATDSYAQHFMINCAHPEHFSHILEDAGQWKNRIRGIRANASVKSHTELNESTTLDTGDKCALAKNYLELKLLLPSLRIIGGCCGTDHTHLEEVCRQMFQEA